MSATKFYLIPTINLECSCMIRVQPFLFHPQHPIAELPPMDSTDTFKVKNEPAPSNLIALEPHTTTRGKCNVNVRFALDMKINKCPSYSH